MKLKVFNRQITACLAVSALLCASLHLEGLQTSLQASSGQLLSIVHAQHSKVSRETLSRKKTSQAEHLETKVVQYSRGLNVFGRSLASFSQGACQSTLAPSSQLREVRRCLNLSDLTAFWSSLFSNGPANGTWLQTQSFRAVPAVSFDVRGLWNNWTWNRLKWNRLKNWFWSACIEKAYLQQILQLLLLASLFIAASWPHMLAMALILPQVVLQLGLAFYSYHKPKASLSLSPGDKEDTTFLERLGFVNSFNSVEQRKIFALAPMMAGAIYGSTPLLLLGLALYIALDSFAVVHFHWQAIFVQNLDSPGRVFRTLSPALSLILIGAVMNCSWLWQLGLGLFFLIYSLRFIVWGVCKPQSTSSSSLVFPSYTDTILPLMLLLSLGSILHFTTSIAWLGIAVCSVAISLLLIVLLLSSLRKKEAPKLVTYPNSLDVSFKIFPDLSQHQDSDWLSSRIHTLFSAFVILTTMMWGIVLCPQFTLSKWAVLIDTLVLTAIALGLIGLFFYRLSQAKKHADIAGQRVPVETALMALVVLSTLACKACLAWLGMSTGFVVVTMITPVLFVLFPKLAGLEVIRRSGRTSFASAHERGHASNLVSWKQVWSQPIEFAFLSVMMVDVLLPGYNWMFWFGLAMFSTLFIAKIIYQNWSFLSIVGKKLHKRTMSNLSSWTTSSGGDSLLRSSLDGRLSAEDDFNDAQSFQTRIQSVLLLDPLAKALGLCGTLASQHRDVEPLDLPQQQLLWHCARSSFQPHVPQRLLGPDINTTDVGALILPIIVAGGSTEIDLTDQAKYSELIQAVQNAVRLPSLHKGDNNRKFLKIITKLQKDLNLIIKNALENPSSFNAQQQLIVKRACQLWLEMRASASDLKSFDEKSSPWLLEQLQLLTADGSVPLELNSGDAHEFNPLAVLQLSLLRLLRELSLARGAELQPLNTQTQEFLKQASKTDCLSFLLELLYSERGRAWLQKCNNENASCFQMITDQCWNQLEASLQSQIRDDLQAVKTLDDQPVLDRLFGAAA